MTISSLITLALKYKSGQPWGQFQRVRGLGSPWAFLQALFASPTKPTTPGLVSRSWEEARGLPGKCECVWGGADRRPLPEPGRSRPPRLPSAHLALGFCPPYRFLGLPPPPGACDCLRDGGRRWPCSRAGCGDRSRDDRPARAPLGEGHRGPLACTCLLPH